MAHKYRTIASFPSKSKPGKKYIVKQDETGALSCSCPPWIYKQWGVRDCPHVRIVRTECRSILKNPRLVRYYRCPHCGHTVSEYWMRKQARKKGHVLEYIDICPKCGSTEWIYSPKMSKNPEPKWVCPNCKAVIWTPMPQAMLKCPVCGKKTKLGESKTNPTGLYEKFHGTSPKGLRRVSFRSPKPGEKVTKVGRLVELVYHPEPPSKRSGSQYVHKFGDYGFKFKNVQPILAVTKDGKQLYIINDKASPKFGERGIVG